MTTAIVESSAATTVMVVGLVNAGAMSLYQAAAVIMGANIGTCVSALISSVGANSNAKRAAFIHLLFNMFGAFVFFIFLVSYKGFMEDTFANWFNGHPETQIAMFHTFFNITCTLIFLPLTNLFVWISRKVIKDIKPKKVQILSIDERMLAYPSVALSQLGKDISLMGYESNKILNLSLDDFLAKEESHKKRVTVSSAFKETITPFL